MPTPYLGFEFGGEGFGGRGREKNIEKHFILFESYFVENDKRMFMLNIFLIFGVL